jgi:hypothetical protein
MGDYREWVRKRTHDLRIAEPIDIVLQLGSWSKSGFMETRLAQCPKKLLDQVRACSALAAQALCLQHREELRLTSIEPGASSSVRTNGFRWSAFLPTSTADSICSLLTENGRRRAQRGNPDGSHVSISRLAYYDKSKQSFVVKALDYEIFVGAHSLDQRTLRARFVVRGK